MSRRALPWICLVLGLSALAIVPAWWLASRASVSQGSLEAFAVERPNEIRHMPTGLRALPLTEQEQQERLELAVGVRSARIELLRRPVSARPVSLRIPALDVQAPVVPVGVDRETGDLDVPDDRTTVGWYRFGPSPGQPGSAVLAGHVDYGEGRAVFFRLRDLELGAVVTVGLSNGSTRRFRVVARRLYDKDRLPARIFATTGRPMLALVTCGGSYDETTRSYEGNIVVYAVLASARA